MAAEPCPLFSEFAVLGEGKHLETSAVGQYGAVPASEFMKSASPVQNVGARTQVEVVCVAEYDLSLYVVA